MVGITLQSNTTIPLSPIICYVRTPPFLVEAWYGETMQYKLPWPLPWSAELRVSRVQQPIGAIYIWPNRHVCSNATYRSHACGV